MSTPHDVAAQRLAEMFDLAADNVEQLAKNLRSYARDARRLDPHKPAAAANLVAVATKEVNATVSTLGLSMMTQKAVDVALTAVTQKLTQEG